MAHLEDNLYFKTVQGLLPQQNDENFRKKILRMNGKLRR